MKKLLLKNVCMIIAAWVCGVPAVEPNFMETTTYDVDGNIGGADNDLVSTEYSNGLGRGIEAKLKLTDDTDRVSCTFYDEAGRPKYATKPFIDIINSGSYLRGEISDNETIDNDVEQQLFNSYSDPRAFSETQYWDDPLGMVRTATGPGDLNDFGVVKSWTMGVLLTIALNDTVPGTGWVNFSEGFIKGLEVTGAMKKTEDLLDGVYAQFLTKNPFSSRAVPTHFLRVSMAPDGKISEELKDLFGRTVRTFYAPDVNGVTGSKIIAGYSHDILGNVLAEIPPAAIDTNEHAVYHYNSLGRMHYKRTPDNGVFGYEYRDDGQLDCVTSYIGTQWVRKIRYDYNDHLGRVTGIYCDLPGGVSEQVIHYFYDTAEVLKTWAVFSSIPDYYFAQLTNLKGCVAGRVTSNIRESNKFTDVGEVFSYDDEGRINRKYLAIAGSPLYQETVFTYDIHGKATAEYFYYSGDHIRKRYVYDRLGRLSKVYNGRQKDTSYAETELVHNRYDQLGRPGIRKLSAIGKGSAYEVGYVFDIRDRLKALHASAGGGQGFTEDIDYEKSGNIYNTQNTYIFNAGGTSFTKAWNLHYRYDDLNRLDAVTGTDINFNATYDYDAVGRFKYKQEGSGNLTDYSYYPKTNRLKNTGKNSGGGRDYIYDKHGNLVVDFTKNMVIRYDWRDMPCMYRFYTNLSSAAISPDEKGTYNGTDLYEYLRSQVDDHKVSLVSSVIMLYDADGNRVCKMDIRE